MMGLMVDASQNIHTNFGVLLLPDIGVHHSGEELTELKTASWSTSAANSRSKLVMVTPGLVNLTRYRMMSAGRFTY